MDPITPALLTAVYAAIKKRVAGAAVERLVEGAQVAAKKMRVLLPDGDEKKLAELLVNYVLAEAAAFPPDKAVLVEPLSTVGTVGIFGPQGRLQVSLLWVNRADFPIRVSNVHLTGRIGGKAPEWEIREGDEFVLDGRSDEERPLKGNPGIALPPIERGGTQVELTMSALLSGPWDEGQAHRTHNIVKTSVWLPAPGMEPPPPTDLIANDADVDLVLAEVLQDQFAKTHTVNIHYAAVDRDKKLRRGATKDRLQHVARKLGHQVEAGVELARVAEGQVVLADGGWSGSDNDY
jgi:hypothetical protein